MSKQATLDRRRAERIQREHASAARERRTRRAKLLAAAGGAAAVLAVTAALVSAHGGATAPRAAAPAATTSQFAGIPEHDGVLGNPKAPLTVTEYLDLQCPICREASTSTIPALIRDYVRTGKVKLAVRTLHFIGPDSTRAARVAAAAQQQGRLWPFVEAFYARQGTENTGYVTDAFLRGVATAAGVDASSALSGANGAFATAQLKAADSGANRLAITGTPTLTVTPKGGKETVLSASPLDPAAVSAELNGLGA